MMKQQTFSDIEYSNRKRKTKREEFLETMNEIIPWKQWCEIIRPYYPSGERGRPPKGIELMLRMYLMQNWFNLSDEGMEDAIYDSYAMRNFLGINFLTEQVPDATTLLKFRHLLERNQIGEKIFADVKERLEKAGLIMHGGSIVDATIIAAPSSTKNQEKKRDPEMSPTQKGTQWYFGMKIHTGVDAGSGYVHTVTATAANVHDIEETSKLIREDDEVVYGDSGYTGAEKREEIQSDAHLSTVEFRINAKPKRKKKGTKSRSKKKKAQDQEKKPVYEGINWDKEIDSRKSVTRCRTEHPFLIVKNQFGYRKVVYRGLAKNLHRFQVLFASANLIMCARAGRAKDFCMA